MGGTQRGIAWKKHQPKVVGTVLSGSKPGTPPKKNIPPVQPAGHRGTGTGVDVGSPSPYRALQVGQGWSKMWQVSQAGKAGVYEQISSFT